MSSASSPRVSSFPSADCNSRQFAKFADRFKVRCSMFGVRCLSFALFLVLCSTGIASPSEGILPSGKDGRPLNLDFETGTLQDWTATGSAFAKQPVKGDTVS